MALLTEKWGKDEISEEEYDSQTEALTAQLLNGKSPEYMALFSEEQAAERAEIDSRMKAADAALEEAKARQSATATQLEQARSSLVAPPPTEKPSLQAVQDQANRRLLLVLGLIVLASGGYIMLSLGSAGMLEKPTRPAPAAPAPAREPTAASLATADYAGLAKKACDNGWDAIVRRGGIGKFDKTKFDERCVSRLTQAATDCGRTKSNAADVSACIGEAAGSISVRVLEESL